ncbi:DNA polymerase III subunit gamma/tau [Candidatus Poribacteria bacterium]|nr:DNA polymerase III subunit gamma/tau [Candidatus Poribacteria bacterium]
MSYEVLAQKWRPQSFNDVVGQTHVTTTLQNQIRSERIGHAYLFWGPRGTGKTTVARLFAKTVNCQNPTKETEFEKVITGEPCNECQACKEITNGSSFDVIEMDAASNRGIDTIRDLRENVKLSPAAYKYKIYIIDEVHMLTTEGFNALLKTLEEPPSHVIFIMATTEHANIPKTIISRCQDFDFRHIDNEQIIERLQLIANDEEISADTDVLSLIARQSEGCLRDAENLLERLVASAGKELNTTNVEETLGLGSSYLLHELTEAITGRDLSAGLATLDKLSKQGMDLAQCISQLIAYFRDLRLLAIDNQLEELVQSPKSDLPNLKEKADQISVERLSRIVKILMHTNREIKEYGYPQLQLESALVQINAINEIIPLDEIVKKLIEIEQKIETSDVSSAPPISNIPQSNTPEPTSNIDSPSQDSQKQETLVQPAPKPNAEDNTSETNTVKSDHATVRSLDELPAIWDEVKTILKEVSPLLIHGIFKDAVPAKDGDDRIKISCPHGSFSLVDDETIKDTTRIFSDVIGKPIHVELVKAEIPPTEEAPENVEEIPTTPMMRKRQAEEDEQIGPVLELFDAKILDTQ